MAPSSYYDSHSFAKAGSLPELARFNVAFAIVKWLKRYYLPAARAPACFRTLDVARLFSVAACTQLNGPHNEMQKRQTLRKPVLQRLSLRKTLIYKLLI